MVEKAYESLCRVQTFPVLTKMCQAVCVGDSIATVAAKSLSEQLIWQKLYSIEQNNSISFSYCYMKNKRTALFTRTENRKH